MTISQRDWETLYSFSKYGTEVAADLLSITRTTLYARIHKFEDTYKIPPIVLRWSPNVVLSEDGKRLAQEAKSRIGAEYTLRLDLRTLSRGKG
jgi:hypothetical protein